MRCTGSQRTVCQRTVWSGERLERDVQGARGLCSRELCGLEKGLNEMYREPVVCVPEDCVVWRKA